MPVLEVTEKELTPKQKLFAVEYCRVRNATLAAISAGVPEDQASSTASSWMTDKRFRHVQRHVKYLMDQQELRLAKSAEDIKQYIQTVMFFQPLQFFKPGDHGGWLIEEDKWDELPSYIGSLIEEIERRSIRVVEEDGKKKKVTEKSVIWVKLVSKTQAMTLAAKVQLGEKVNVTNLNIDWEDLARRGEAARKGGAIEMLINAPSMPGKRLEVESNSHTSNGHVDNGEDE